jgi:hypothetical protein
VQCNDFLEGKLIFSEGESPGGPVAGPVFPPNNRLLRTPAGPAFPALGWLFVSFYRHGELSGERQCSVMI